MPTPKMHADETHISLSLVSALLEAQFPRWADLPLAPVESGGTDNAIYRLGRDMAVRLPRTPGAAAQVDKEQQWLPRLAPHLPLAIPTPLAQGQPGASYPWRWSIYRWIEGKQINPDSLADPVQAAQDLAGFIAALQHIDAQDGPPPGAHNFYRGVPLAARDRATRSAIAALQGANDANDTINVGAAAQAWEAALAAPAWHGPPVWIHGDLQSGNLLTRRGRLSAVIDFGGLGVGDPACDVLVAWDLFSGKAREAFRAALPVDEATWARGRGWALSFGLIALPYYRHTNPALAGIARRVIDAVLAEHDARP